MSKPLLVAALLFAALAVQAQPFEAVVMGGYQTCSNGEPGFQRQAVEWVNPDAIERPTTIRAIDTNASGRVYALLQEGSAPYQLATIAPDGSATSSQPLRAAARTSSSSRMTARFT